MKRTAVPTWPAVCAVACVLLGPGCKHPGGRARPFDAGRPSAAIGEPAPDFGAVHGQVVAGGAPRAGVRLRLGTAGRTRVAVTDAEGRFRYDHVAAGAYALEAVLPAESLGASLPVDVGLGEASEGAHADGGVPAPPDVELSVELVPTARVTGVVRDEAGRLLVGAFVRVEEPSRPLPVEVESAADGRFSVPDRLRGRTYLVSVRRAGYIADGPRDAVAGGPPLEIRMRRGAALEGSVTDEAGRPIAGAELSVVSEEGDLAAALPADAAASSAGAGGASAGDNWARLEPSGELGVLRGPIPYPPPQPLAASATNGVPTVTTLPRSDSEGRFRIAELSPGNVVVTARHPDYAAGDTVPVELVGGQTRTVRITLRPGTLLRGRVLDEDQVGVADAEVSTSDGRTLITDAHGEFSVPHLVRSVQLRARHPGYLRADASVDITPEQRDAEVELHLRRALGRLGGQVLDPRGEPAADARITITPQKGDAVVVTSGRDGRFRAEGLPDGPYRVTVDRVGSPRLHVPALEATDDARLLLEAGGGIEGEIYDDHTGEPPRDLRLDLVWDDDRRPVPVEGRSFRVLGLPTGPVRLVAQAHGYPTIDRTIEVLPGEREGEVTVRDVRIELALGGRIVGRVRDDNGDPIAGAEVRLVGSPSANEVPPARTDAEGRFVMEGVPSGTARVRAKAKNGDVALTGEDSVEVRANEDSELELSLAPLAPGE